MKTIFISMATIDDTETIPSVLNAISAAKFPERIYIGVSCATKDKSYYKSLVKAFKDKNVKIIYTKLGPKYLGNFGTGQGRLRALSLYDDQDYIVQVDSHTRFDEDWDEKLIDIFEEARKELNDDKIVLTCYLGRYGYSEETKEREIITPVPKYACYNGEMFATYYPAWDDAEIHLLKNTGKKFLPSVKFNGHFAFGNKEFAKNPGTYAEALFYDEEIIQSVNLLDSGFKMVFPNINWFPLTHLYDSDKNEFGGSRYFFTDYLNDKNSRKIQDAAIERYHELIKDHKNLKKIRAYEKYAKINLKLGAIKINYIPENYGGED